MAGRVAGGARPLPARRRLGATLLAATLALGGGISPAADTAGTAPLGLDEAIQRALARNFTIRVQSYEVPIAASRVDEARGFFDPRAYVSYSDETQNNPSGNDAQGRPLPTSVIDTSVLAAGVTGELPLGLNFELGASTVHFRGAFPEETRENHSSGVVGTLRLPLLRGFGRAASFTTIRIANTNLQISEWEFRATVINTITNVVFAYNEVLFAHANLRSARRSRELAAGLHAENQRRQEVGSMSEFDVLSARARVATREEGILVAENYVRDAENALKQLISDETGAGLLQERLTLAPPAAPVEVIVDVVSDLPFALEHRPDFRQAHLALERNDFSYRFYRNQLLPSLNLVGNYGYNGTGSTFSASRDVVTDRTYPTYSTGVTLSFPLTSTAERARYRAARHARTQAEFALRQLEQDIVVNVGRAAADIETAWKRVLATRDARRLSQETLDAEVKKLRAGTGNTFFVLQQQEILGVDEVREARAMADYRNALAEYDRQLGRTLDRFNVEMPATP